MISLSVRQVLVLWAATAVLAVLLGRVCRGEDNTALKPREVTGTVVDEAGNPVAGVELNTEESTLEKPSRTDEKGAFRFLIEEDPRRGFLPGLVIARGGHGRLGLARIRSFSATVKPLRIVLKKPKEINVRVVDGAERPVENASVTFQVDGARFPLGSTDAKGQWSLRLPDEPHEWVVAAFKGGAGYDYEQAPRHVGAARSVSPPLPANVKLRLAGARPPVRIRTVDHHGKPVPHVWVMVQAKGRLLFTGLVKPGQTTAGPVPRLFTGQDGRLTIAWLPNWGERELAFVGVARDQSYYPEDLDGVACDPATREAKLVLLPMRTVSGRITLSNGKPAAGATVRAASLIRDGGPLAATAKTDGNGRYKIPVRSKDAYVLYASLDDAAYYHRDPFVVAPDEPVNDIDLVLTRATVVAGRVFLDRDRQTAPRFGQIEVWAYTNPLTPEVRKLVTGSPKQAHVIMFGEYYKKDEGFRLLLPWGHYALRFAHLQDKAMQYHDVRFSIPLLSPPPEIKRDLILSEIPKAE